MAQRINVGFVGLLLCILAVFISDVLGQRPANWSEGSLRLVGGRTTNEGTVLIYHWSMWGAICDDQWDIKDANVVCNELGYAGAQDAPRKSQFGKGRRRVWLSGLHCRGNERHITMCYSRGWGNHVDRCNSYWSSAGVVCNPRLHLSSPSTRNSSKSSELSADTTKLPTTKKLSITTTPAAATRTTMTTTVPTTKIQPAATTHSTIPFISTTAITTTSTSPTTSNKTTVSFQPSTTSTTTQTPTTITAITKPLTTTRPLSTTKTTTTTTQRSSTSANREYGKWVYNREMWRYFMYFRDGSFITSKPDPRYYQQNATTKITTTTTTTQRPRRTQHNNNINNQLGGENDNDIQLLNVININPNAPTNNAVLHEHRRHHNDIRNDYLGDQPQLADNKKDNNIEDDENDIPDVVRHPRTTPKAIAPSYTEFRLAGGREYSGYKEGRLEVRLAGSNTWGVVCGDNWNFRSAIVTCKHFGAGYARTHQTTDFYGGSNMDKVLATVRCTGQEQRLEDCTLEKTEMIPGRPKCSRSGSVAGVICDTKLPDLEGNAKAVEESTFLSDQYLYYLQCAFEEQCLSSSANELYGSHRWTFASRRLLRFSTIAKNIGTADFRPFVDRSKWEWHACHQHYHSMEAFSHYDIIDKHGNKIAEGHKASFCLEDSSCDRGVHPKYHCLNYGHQGISIGCQDSYLADIDCQWIDVTDVKAGQYTLKIEINPDMKVPEISYDNNVITCDLYFNTQQARAWNCKLESLL